jgi:DNA replication protein DnaC
MSGQESKCSLCNDTGWKMVVKDGREYAQKCECQAVDSYLAMGRKANIPPRFLNVNLENYYTDKNNPSIGDAKQVVEAFIRDYPAVMKGLLLQGPTGVGKTRLLCTVALELLKKFKQDIDIYYVDWNDLVQEMRFGDHVVNRDFSYINRLITRLAEADLLLFDELGATMAIPWILDHIYYLFNKRYNNQKITVCATNYLDESINNQETLNKRVSERIRSRLYEMTQIVLIRGDDLRTLDRGDKHI